MMTNIVDVAVGLIVQGDHTLIAWRGAERHQGDRYEFAGGKVDAGETPAQALVRELHEELGIEVLHASFLQRLTYAYPEKTVCLHVYRVDQFAGTPQGREGQPLHWVPIHQLDQYAFPDANAPIVRAAQLPRHYIVSPDGQDGQQAWLAQQCALPPASWLYVRLPHVSWDQQVNWMTALQQQRPDLQLIIASELQDRGLMVRGYHLRHQQLMQCTALPRRSVLHMWFAACHDQASLQQAERLGVDAVLVGAVHATPTHPDQQGMGWEGLSALIANRALPVYALGGVRPEDLPQAQQAGAYGVAGIRAFYP